MSASKEADYITKANSYGINLRQRKDIQERQKKIEAKERNEADVILSKELESIGIEAEKKEVDYHAEKVESHNKKLSVEDRVKGFAEKIKRGKSPNEILKILIQKFEKEEAVKTWVKNWKNFLKLHELSQTKPKVEQKVIQQIILSADFSEASAFKDSLAEIAKSNVLSTETKLEIAQEFNGSKISSIERMDFALNELKTNKKRATKLLALKQTEKLSLNSEIKKLKTAAKKLPFNSPKREQLETKLDQIEQALISNQDTIEQLDKEATREVSFPLRSGFIVRLNPNSSRSIMLAKDFEIQLPSNALPFTDGKNLRSLNLCFVAAPILNHVADVLFSPKLVNATVPTKNQRKLGHFILSALGYDDSQILDERAVEQLHIDLSRLVFSSLGKSGEERLSELRIYDAVSKKVDKTQLQVVLEIIKENRGMRDKYLAEKLKEGVK